MNEYDLILEELNERVECGELTLEEAELINDYAYDKYVIEGNAFNKLVNDKYKNYKKIEKKIDNMEKADKILRPKGKARELWDQKMRKAKSDYSKANYSITPDEYYGISKYHAISTGNYDNENSRTIKQRWMKQHGNNGVSPEERYKPGRYLQAQKLLREQ